MAEPRVSLVFLAYNRREKLRESLRRMLVESDYDRELTEAIVVDNASTDGTAEMMRHEFPEVRLIERAHNVGVSGWNDGFAVARGDWVLALDDDCYLPPGGLRQALNAAREHAADLVSFKVVSTYDPELIFTDGYRTGLFAFWGCAVLIRKPVLDELGGYDPEIFVWGNELEFMLRFFDRGHRHLHLPEVVAQHMKPRVDSFRVIHDPTYRINARNWGYIAAKLLRPRDALETLIALSTRCLRDGLREDPAALRAVPDTFTGFIHGLRQRRPVQNAAVSRAFRMHFMSFASFWWFTRPIRQLLQSLLGRGTPGGAKIEAYYERRARFYPERAATLKF